MPDKSAHIGAARKNEKFADLILVHYPDYREWAVVGYFYSAVHWIEAYLAIRNVHSFSHKDREYLIKGEPLLRKIDSEYYELKNQSKRARYSLKSFSDAEIADIAQNLLPIKETISDCFNRA